MADRPPPRRPTGGPPGGRPPSGPAGTRPPGGPAGTRPPGGRSRGPRDEAPAQTRGRAGRPHPRAATSPARPEKAPGSGDRIAKLLARAGAGSRRDIERMIEDGRVALHGKVLETPATILTSLDGVTLDGHPVSEAESTRLFLFHKPAGVLTAARDPAGRPTIYDILPAGLPRLVPVGRLDLNTEGLLLLTNDGELKRSLELPSSGVPRTYRIRAYGEVRQSDLEQLALGVTIEGMRYGPIDASVERRVTGGSRNIWMQMTLSEGKNREVRRVCEAMGLQVSRLIRVGYGPFLLGDIPVREVAEAPASALAQLRRSIKPAKPVPARPVVDRPTSEKP